MLLRVTLRLTSPLLGKHGPDSEGVHRFHKIGSDTLDLGTDFLREQLRRAAVNVGSSGKSVNRVQVYGLRTPSLHLFQRRATAVRKVPHESCRTGTHLDLDLFVDESRDDYPSEEELHVWLTYVGKFFGISPYGSNNGFGRFELLNLCRQDPRQCVSTGETPNSTS